MADDRNRGSDRGLSPALIGGIVVALAAIAFIAQNRRDVTIHFLVWDSKKPLWVLLLITSVLAVIAAELIAIAIRRSRRD